MSGFMPTGLIQDFANGDTPSILPAILALICAAVLFILYRAIAAKAPMARRLKGLAARRAALRGELEAARIKRRTRITQHSATSIQVQGVMAKLRLLQQEQLSAAESKLLHAGIRSKDWAVAVILARAVLLVVLGGTAFVLLYATQIWPDLSPTKRLVYAAGTMILSYKGPDIFIQNLITKRVDAIRKGLPDALDLMIICAEAGLTIDAAFGRVSRELGRSYPELADEFALTSIELGFLSDRRIAFENLATRIPLESIRGVVTTMVQTEKYGTPIATALRVLTAEFRNERMMRAEAKAARLPALMTVPMILFTLPPLFIVIMGPGACQIVDSFSTVS